MSKMSGYVKTFKMSFCTDDEKLLQKYKAIWTKIEDLKNIELNALPVYDDRYIKTKKDHMVMKMMMMIEKMIYNVNL